MKVLSYIAVILLSVAIAQNIGYNKQEYHLPLTVHECQASGSCSSQNAKVTLDSNWRWLHNNNGYQNCYTGNTWDTTICPDVQTCIDKCVIEGVTTDDWNSPYGVSSTGNDLKLNFVTRGQYGNNIGSRNYLLSDDDNYYMFKLKNKEFTFDVDVSNLPCGLNGALYFVAMDQDGGKTAHPTNEGGARYGEGYCDAQCPHDLKWIDGEANVLNWKPSSTDSNSGVGKYGSCCVEMDIWEANKYDQAFTVHPCEIVGQHRCEGTECGDNTSGDRYNGICDKDGCDFNSYRMGDSSFFGPGSFYKLDSTKPMTVVTQFITHDGTDTGALSEIRRIFVQNGNVIQNSNTNLAGLPQYNSITANHCNQQKTLFGETNDFAKKGGLAAIDQALVKGLVLVMSVWDDHDANMLWLDSDYPLSKDRNTPGVQRGPCSRDSGKPTQVENDSPNSSVTYSNIRSGPLGSTYSKQVSSFLEI